MICELSNTSTNMNDQDYIPNLLENRVMALRGIAANFLDSYKRQITAPDTLPPGDTMEKARMLKSSLETVYKDMIEVMK